MKTRYIAIPTNKRTGIIALLLALAIPLLALYSCSTGTEPDEPVSLEGTSWKLTSIEAINDSVFQQYENGFWEVPKDQIYSLTFYDKYVSIQADCEPLGGEYFIASPDSLYILVDSRLDIVCNKNLQFNYRLSAVLTFKKERSTLHLYYSDYWVNMEGYLHFEEMETEE